VLLSTAVLVCALGQLPGGVAWAESAASAHGLQSLFELAEHGLIRLADAIRLGVERQPAVMLAAAVAVSIPVVGLVAALIRGLMRLRRWWKGPASILAAGNVVTGRPMGSLAWIEMESSALPPMAIGELIRIGHSDDCDLALGGSTAGLQALIHRTSDRGFVIVDVGGQEDYRLAVNGAPSRQHRLRDGDRIEIAGRGIVFREGQGSPSAGVQMRPD
jgi:hypothetical protein